MDNDENKISNATVVVTIIVLIVILIGGIIIYGYSSPSSGGGGLSPINHGNNNFSQGSSTNPGNIGVGSTTGTSTAGRNEKKFTVIGKNFSLSPGTITVNRGDLVSVTFKNTEGFHGFELDEFGVKTKILRAGESETVRFTADKTGSFEYYCPVDNHRIMGMKGILTVR